MRALGNDGLVRSAADSRATPILSSYWWIPSAFAILALAMLLVVPVVVDQRIRALRGELSLVSEVARVELNDLEASFASQLLVRNGAMQPKDIPPFATRAHLDADKAGLQAAVEKIGPDAVALLAALTNRLVTWDASSHDGSAATAREGLEVLASAERLDSLLTALTSARRDAIRKLEWYYVVTPAVLAPIALIAIVVVMWSGRRMLRFARLAEEERALVVRAAETRAALLRGVTHDVKNPLGAAAGYAQLLEEGVVGQVSAPQLEMIRRIHRLVRSAVQTVSDLLELARSDGMLHVEYATVDLAALVNEVVEDHGGMAQARALTITVSAPSTPLVTDPLRVRQVLANLVSNAIKYTPRGGEIHVSIVRGGRHEGTGVEVRDTGPGIPPALHARVFEEFFRVRNAGAGVENGNGLGLAISRRIARLLGGDVTFANGEAVGAVFTLWLTSSRPASAPVD